MKSLLSTLIHSSERLNMKPLVLVVDDEACVRLLVRRWLERWGYRVREASGAIEALEMMDVEQASVIVCDVKMPGPNGLWLVEVVRAKWPETAIIMATGVADIEMVLDCKRAGAVDYVLKPFGREVLQQAVQRAEKAIASLSSARVQATPSPLQIWAATPTDQRPAGASHQFAGV
jgi:DNA-binding NtrC family response regulator